LKYIEGYGLTETMAAVLFNPSEHPKAQCGGLPMFNTAAFIADPASVEGLPQGEIGEILVSGDQLFSGYWNQPEADAQVYIEINGPTSMGTGDLGYVDKDVYFFIVARLKRVINASGFKVWPAEVESVLYQHPGVQEACVIASKDVQRGETAKAIIVS